MSSPEVIYACRWLIRDTLRQSLANRMFWVMLGASSVVIFFCLGVGIEGEAPRAPDDIEVHQARGTMTLAFGAWPITLPRERVSQSRLTYEEAGRSGVQLLLLLLAEWVAGAGGIILALVCTAGFIPEFLQPANATVLMSKPIPRWVLLLGKYLGVLTFVGIQVTIFIAGTWLALGLVTGFWINSYLWGIPLLILHFAAVYSFSVFLAVLTRSTLACVFGSIAFWVLCYGMNYGRNSLLVLQAHMPPVKAVLRGLIEACYWILPKPEDLSMLFYSAVDASDFFAIESLQKIQKAGGFHPELSLATSFLFAAVMIFVAARQLEATDY